MNFIFKNGPGVTIIDSGCHENRLSPSVVRKFAVIIPCLLVCAHLAFGSDGRGECLDGFGVQCEGASQESAGIWPVVVGAVTPSFLKESESRFESGTQLYPGGEESESTLTPQLKPVIGKDAKQATAKGDKRDDYRGLYNWLLTAYSIEMMQLMMCPRP